MVAGDGAVGLHRDVRGAFGRAEQLQFFALLRIVIAEGDHLRDDYLIALVDGDLRAGQDLLRRKIRRIFLDVQADERSSLFRRLLRLRQHRADAVADEAHVIRKDRLLVGDLFRRPHPAPVVFRLGHVLPGEDRCDAGHFFRFRCIHAPHPAVGHGA